MSLSVPLSDRRRQRSANTTRALCLQLDASLREGDLEGMILTDDNGVCLAAAGDGYACDEVAAQIPLVAREAQCFDGVLPGPGCEWDISMQRFEVLDSPLYLCAIGGSRAKSESLHHSIRGVSRILLPTQHYPQNAHQE